MSATPTMEDVLMSVIIVLAVTSVPVGLDTILMPTIMDAMVIL